MLHNMGRTSALPDAMDAYSLHATDVYSLHATDAYSLHATDVYSLHAPALAGAHAVFCNSSNEKDSDSNTNTMHCTVKILLL